MRKPITIDMSRPRKSIRAFLIGDKVCFVKTVDRHDQAEHPDPLPVINAGSLGVILENDGKSVLVGVIEGPGKKVNRSVRLYDTAPEEDDCPLCAIEHLHRLTRQRRLLPPETTTFSGEPDPCLDNPSSRPRRRKLEDILRALKG